MIDIIVGVPDKKTAEETIRILKTLGSAYISRGADQDLNCFCCACRVYGGVSIHLHSVKYDSHFHLKHIIFRDWLRVHPEDARRYYELKLGLAEKYSSDVKAYADDKTDFINIIVEKAKGRKGI
jgi:GrpB-like predicted nucleotidyltransferase (UPF0157 family)